ncbi:hypothetical protein PR048_025095 [Dryococelus australis]|uniref:Uncharacterized protein n=1 Tax=Dryococelus australis TaxID=614101 RepID=A0ABQ9GQG3_9NEOP|nr:hypothetical protein PR048_025095 [Dryococelus australis]
MQFDILKATRERCFNFYSRIVRTGLEAVPDMVGMGSGAIVHMIDLESNRFKRLKTNVIKVKTERLSLSGNKDLSQLSMDAFRGLKNLQDFRVQCSIGRCFASTLRVDKDGVCCWLQHLQEAHLTYSFHCCAFKFPAKHDPSRHARHQLYKCTISTTRAAALAERSARSTLSKANRVQFPAGSLPGRITRGFSHVGIAPDDAAGRQVSPGVSRFPCPSIPALLLTNLISPSSALNTSSLRAAQLSQLNTHGKTADGKISPHLLLEPTRSAFNMRMVKLRISKRCCYVLGPYPKCLGLDANRHWSGFFVARACTATKDPE